MKEPEEMTDEELDNEINGLGEDDNAEESTEEPEAEETEEQELEEAITEEDAQEESSDEEETSNEDKRFENASKDDVIKSYNELNTLIGKQGRELGELRKQLEAAQLKKEEPPEPEEEPYDPDMYVELLATDPAKATQYQYEKFILPQIERGQAEKKKQDEEQAQQARIAEITQKQTEAFEEFGKLDEFKNIDEKEALAFAEFLRNNTLPGKKGYYDVEDLKTKYGWFNPKAGQAAAAKKVLDAVEENAPVVKTLGNAKNAKSKSTKAFKSVDNVIDAAREAEGYTDEELDKLITEMD